MKVQFTNHQIIRIAVIENVNSPNFSIFFLFFFYVGWHILHIVYISRSLNWICDRNEFRYIILCCFAIQRTKVVIANNFAYEIRILKWKYSVNCDTLIIPQTFSSYFFLFTKSSKNKLNCSTINSMYSSIYKCSLSIVKSIKSSFRRQKNIFYVPHKNRNPFLIFILMDLWIIKEVWKKKYFSWNRREFLTTVLIFWLH